MAGFLSKRTNLNYIFTTSKAMPRDIRLQIFQNDNNHLHL